MFLFFISCSEDDQTPVDLVTQNDQEIQDYLEENDLEAQKTASGLY